MRGGAESEGAAGTIGAPGSGLAAQACELLPRRGTHPPTHPPTHTLKKIRWPPVPSASSIQWALLGAVAAVAALSTRPTVKGSASQSESALINSVQLPRPADCSRQQAGSREAGVGWLVVKQRHQQRRWHQQQRGGGVNSCKHVLTLMVKGAPSRVPLLPSARWSSQRCRSEPSSAEWVTRALLWLSSLA